MTSAHRSSAADQVAESVGRAVLCAELQRELADVQLWRRWGEAIVRADIEPKDLPASVDVDKFEEARRFIRLEAIPLLAGLEIRLRRVLALPPDAPVKAYRRRLTRLADCFDQWDGLMPEISRFAMELALMACPAEGNA